MKTIDIEKIYSSNEKKANHSVISVFFDKERRLKRHADGTKLIKSFVNPMLT